MFFNDIAFFNLMANFLKVYFVRIKYIMCDVIVIN